MPLGFGVYAVRRGSWLSFITARSRKVLRCSRALRRRGRSGPGSGWPSSEFLAKASSIHDAMRTRSSAVGCGRSDGGICRAFIRSQTRAQTFAAYLVPGEGVVDPGQFVAGLAKAVVERGGRVHENTQVTGLRRRGDEVLAVQTSAGELRCQAVAVTAGSWSGQR